VQLGPERVEGEAAGRPWRRVTLCPGRSAAATMADARLNKSRRDIRVERIGPKREAVGADLRLKVREAFESLLQNFAALLKAAGGGSALEEGKSANTPPFAAEVSRNDYGMRVAGSNIVRAAERLLTLSGKVQRLLVVNDHATLTAHRHDRAAELRAHRTEVYRQLAELRDDIAAHIGKLGDEVAR